MIQSYFQPGPTSVYCYCCAAAYIFILAGHSLDVSQLVLWGRAEGHTASGFCPNRRSFSWEQEWRKSAAHRAAMQRAGVPPQNPLIASSRVFVLNGSKIWLWEDLLSYIISRAFRNTCIQTVYKNDSHIELKSHLQISVLNASSSSSSSAHAFAGIPAHCELFFQICFWHSCLYLIMDVLNSYEDAFAPKSWLAPADTSWNCCPYQLQLASCPYSYSLRRHFFRHVNTNVHAEIAQLGDR